jgi:putative hemolysin
MIGQNTLYIGLVIVLTICGAFLALAEIALSRMTKAKALSLQEQKRRGATKLVKLVERPENWMNPLIFLVLVVTTLSAILFGAVLEQYGTAGAVLAVIGNVVVFFVFAEAAPKTFAIQHTDRAALFAAPIISAVVDFWPLRIIARALIGLSNILLPGKGLRTGPFVTESELIATVGEAKQAGEIEPDEESLITSVIEFGDTIVREVMKPRPDMVGIELSRTVADALNVAIEAGYSRIPVYRESIDDIVGVAFVKDLVNADRADNSSAIVGDYVHDVRYVPETKRTLEMLREMQRDKLHIAIVIDEFGGTAGLVTLEDLIEELVGEIVDEFDTEESLVEPLGGGQWRVSARMAVSEVNDLLHTELPDDDWDTMGGLVIGLLGHVAREGEQAEVDGAVLVAERVQGRRVGRVRVVLTDPQLIATHQHEADQLDSVDAP